MKEQNKIRSYTKVDTHIIYDKNVSLKAKGMYLTLVGLPDEWNHVQKGYAGLVRDGVTAVSSALQELEKTGYLKRERFREKDGKFKTRICLYLEPGLAIPDTKSTDSVSSESDNQSVNIIYQDNIKEDISKETNIDNYTDLLTADLNAFEKFFHRKLSPTEVPIWESWKEQEVNPKILILAVKDNEFRKDKLNLEHVDATLKSWKKRELTTVKQIKNHILEVKYDHTRVSLRNQFPIECDEEFENALAGSDVGRIREWRDDMQSWYWKYARNRTEQQPVLYDFLVHCPSYVFQYIDDSILRDCAIVAQKYGNKKLMETLMNNMEGCGNYGRS